MQVLQFLAPLCLAGSLVAQGVGVGLVPSGVEAPAQPNTRSTATYEVAPRFTPVPGRGAAGRSITATVETLVDVRGQEENLITGIGVVSGLGGSGDSVNMTRQLLENVLLANNVRIDAQQLTPKNVAIVSVEATLLPGVQPGRRIDVRVTKK